MNKDNVTTSSPLADPTQVEALRHPGDVDALRQPGVVTHADKPVREQGFISHDEVTHPGLESEELPVARVELVIPAPCQATPRCVHDEGHPGECLPPPELNPGQAAYAIHEAGCLAVRRAVVLPQMPPAYYGTRDLYRTLVAGQQLVHVWADIGDDTLGEITHAQPGCHAAMMNVSAFSAQALEYLGRAVGRPAEWTATFNAIVDEAGKSKAWRLLAIASTALMAGPFTETWDSAVEFCLAFWSTT